MDSLWAQLRSVNRRLDEVQHEFHKSKEELGEASSGALPFTPEVLDKLVPPSFHLPTLEAYDGGSDPNGPIRYFEPK